MIIFKGIGVFGDIAFGMLSVNKENFENVDKRKVSNVEEEIKRYCSAREKAIKDVRTLYEKALNNFGAAEAEIFAVHEMMIKDKDYENTIVDIIREKKINAEYAVWNTSHKFSQIFLKMNDKYMSQRAADVRDISQRIINCLTGSKKLLNYQKNTVILSVRDLTPGDVSSLNRSKVAGLILSKGSEYSHAAIISKVLKIPTVVNLNKTIKPEYDGKKVIIDSFSGNVYVDPDEETEKRMLKKKEETDKRYELLKYLKGRENVTIDGRKVDIYANLNNPDEIKNVLENDAGGIGLFRSEFLYMNRDSCPDEEEQFNIYKNIIQKMGDKRVIIRTLDIGSDKCVDYFNFPPEKNPALGYRGIRVCLDNPDMFTAQLRAIYRASAFGNVCIMFPMIISSEEVKAIKKYVEDVKKGLAESKLNFSSDVPLGIMIETPAAAVISDELAEFVDFFSIGTNDLTQYTLAIDRQNSKVGKLSDPHHKAVLRFIKMVVENAHKKGKWVGICGELASDESLTGLFLSMGIDELSVSPSSVLSIRKKVIETDTTRIKDYF